VKWNFSEISENIFSIQLGLIDQDQLQDSASLTSNIVLSIIKNKKGNTFNL